MTDNGLAALTTVLRDMTSPMRSLMGRQGQFNDAFWQREAAAILAPRGVFLPEGLGPVMVGMAEEIAALRAALDLLVGDIRDVGPDEPPQRMIPAQHRVSDIGRARAVLAIINPEETDHE